MNSKNEGCYGKFKAASALMRSCRACNVENECYRETQKTRNKSKEPEINQKNLKLRIHNEN